MSVDIKPPRQHLLANDTMEEKQHVSKNSPKMGRVQALLRCRPLLPVLEEGHSCKRLHVLKSANTVVVNDFSEASEGGGARQFSFDFVLPPEASQEETFGEVAHLVDHVLDGYHATVFAYGQTGSGKTHTMEGLLYTSSLKKNRRKRRQKGLPLPNFDTPVELFGVIPRFIQGIFANARQREAETGPPRGFGTDAAQDDGVCYTLKCSYYQIYNETVSDLLRSQRKQKACQQCNVSNLGQRTGVHNKGLRIRWQHDNTFRVENLFIYECESPEEMCDAFFGGVREKVVCSHLLNESSSRSHSIFTIYVECRRSKTLEVVRRSELTLVDLAGSERLSLLARDPSAAFMKESIDINTSLLALGKVIMSLADTSKKSSTPGEGGTMTTRRSKVHIPYRDSKLTKLLQHALGGNSITLMIACISASDRYIEESISTMLYTGRARNIENVPHINQNTTTTQIDRLRGEIVSLQEELRHYRDLALNHLAPLSTLAEGASPVDFTAEQGEVPAAKPRVVNEIESSESSQATPCGEESAPGEASRAQMDQLATALIDACAMLQQIIVVNSQLRNGCDAALKAKEISERREAVLNAENLALRERIEMLESITLNKVFLDDKKDEEDEETAQSTCLYNIWEAHLDPTNDVGLLGDTFSSLKPLPLESRTLGKGGCSDSKISKETVGSLSSHRSFSKGLECENLVPGRRCEGAKTPGGFDFNGEKTITTKSNQADTSKAKENGNKPKTTPDILESLRAIVSLMNCERKRSKECPERLSHSHEDGKLLNCGTDSKDKTKKRRRRIKRMLVKRLMEYENRYRVRASLEPYGSSLAADSEGLPSSSQHSWNWLQPQKTFTAAPWGGGNIVAVKETEKLLRKVPPGITNTFVPKSAWSLSSYGKLNFGGEKEDVEPFESKRQDHKAKLAELLARREELQLSLRKDIYGRFSHLEQERMCDDGKEMGRGFHNPSLLSKEATVQGRSLDTPYSPVVAEVPGHEINLGGRHYADFTHVSPYELAGLLRTPLKSLKKRPQHSVGSMERLLKYLSSDKVL